MVGRRPVVASHATLQLVTHFIRYRVTPPVVCHLCRSPQLRQYILYVDSHTCFARNDSTLPNREPTDDDATLHKLPTNPSV